MIVSTTEIRTIFHSRQLKATIKSRSSYIVSVGTACTMLAKIPGINRNIVQEVACIIRVIGSDIPTLIQFFLSLDDTGSLKMILEIEMAGWSDMNI